MKFHASLCLLAISSMWLTALLAPERWLAWVWLPAIGVNGWMMWMGE